MHVPTPMAGQKCACAVFVIRIAGMHPKQEPAAVEVLLEAQRKPTIHHACQDQSD